MKYVEMTETDGYYTCHCPYCRDSKVRFRIVGLRAEYTSFCQHVLYVETTNATVPRTMMMHFWEPLGVGE